MILPSVQRVLWVVTACVALLSLPTVGKTSNLGVGVESFVHAVEINDHTLKRNDTLHQVQSKAWEGLTRIQITIDEGVRLCGPPAKEFLGKLQERAHAGVVAAGGAARSAATGAIEAVSILGGERKKGFSTTLNTKVLVGEESFTGEHDEINNRAACFWLRSATIYFAYKKLQMECWVRLRGVDDPDERDRRRRHLFEALHEVNSERMLNMCLELKGFYLKAGQFLGTRHDFMPPQYCKKLSQLLDQVPPMPEEQVRHEIEVGLGLAVDEIFSELNLREPVGSASISQVHEGRLKSTGEKVAVKVQFPGGEQTMLHDLSNLRRLASFLQRHELNFDLVSPVDELRKQVRQEFDFFKEAQSMDFMSASLKRAVPEVSVPTSRLVSKKVLVMSYIEGVPFSRLLAPSLLTRRLFSRRGKRMLEVLSSAWGHMLFEEGLFNADPHPGNILLLPDTRLGLLDWGQVKTVPQDLQVKLATLMEALRVGDSGPIADSFCALGIQVQNPEDKESTALLAVSMFDTRQVPGLEMNPLSPKSTLQTNAVKGFPSDLFFVLRTVQMLRGLASGMGVPFSVAEEWLPHTEKLLGGMDVASPFCPS